MNISLVTRFWKDLCTFHSQITIFEINFDGYRRISFLIKKEKVLIKHIEILEKFKNSIKDKFNSEVIYSKKYLKAEKKKTQTQTQMIQVYLKEK